MLIVLDVQKRHALIVPGLLDFDASARGCVVRGVSLEVSTLVAEPVASSTSRAADVARRARFRCTIGPGVCSSRRLVPNYLSVSAFVLACPLATRPPSHIHARFPPMAAHSKCPRSVQPTRGRRARSSLCRSQSSASGYVAAPRQAPPKLFLTFSPLPMSRSVVTTCGASSTTTCSASSEFVLPVTPRRLDSSVYESSHTPRSPDLTPPAPQSTHCSGFAAHAWS